MATSKSTVRSTASTKVTAKETAVKTTPTVKAEKVQETKTAEKAPVVQKDTTVKAEEKKAPAKKTTAKKTVKPAEKKAPAKKAAKAEAVAEVYVEYAGKQVNEKDMIENAKKTWVYETGKKESDIKSISLYVKPEDGAVYFIVNGTDEGKITF